MMPAHDEGAAMYGRGYNLWLGIFWLAVLGFVLSRELILPANVASRFAGPEGWLAVLVAAAFAIYNFSRWWMLRSSAVNRGYRVNPLAEHLPDPDNPRPKYERNPELDFTKREEKTENEPRMNTDKHG
jgi:hypothetical protein